MGTKKYSRNDDSEMRRYIQKKIFENEKIWDGYVKHWENTAVIARRLTQLDYEDGSPIIIMWPDEPIPDKPFVQIYYNERLVKYFDSTLGHLAINVNGKIFNFAKKIPFSFSSAEIKLLALFLNLEIIDLAFQISLLALNPYSLTRTFSSSILTLSLFVKYS